MNKPLNVEIIARLERLEAANGALQRERRRWRRGGLAAAAVGMVVGLAGADVATRVAPIVEANEFVLRDQAGKARAALTIRPDGTPGFALFDADEKARLSLDLGTKDQATPGLNIYGEQGELRAALTIRPDGTPGLGLFNKERQPRLSLDLCADGSAGVNLYGDAAKLRAALAVRSDGSPGLGLFDGQGQVAQSIDLDASPEIRAAAH